MMIHVRIGEPRIAEIIFFFLIMSRIKPAFGYAKNILRSKVHLTKSMKAKSMYCKD